MNHRENGSEKMSKLTQRKSLDYIKGDYVRTRQMPGSWYLSNYRYKYNMTHLQPFLDKLKEKKLVGLECSGCNRVFFPPRFVCGKCLVKPDKWVDLRETGRISTYAISYLRNPETEEIQEKPIVLIQLDGADTSSITQLDPKIDFKDTYIGMPTKVHWTENPTGSFMDIEFHDVLKDDSEDLELRED
jgi:uncharacterized OB-fold protein